VLKSHHVCGILCMLVHIVIMIATLFLMIVTSVYFSIIKKRLMLVYEKRESCFQNMIEMCLSSILVSFTKRYVIVSKYLCELCACI